MSNNTDEDDAEVSTQDKNSIHQYLLAGAEYVYHSPTLHLLNFVVLAHCCLTFRKQDGLDNQSIHFWISLVYSTQVFLMRHSMMNKSMTMSKNSLTILRLGLKFLTRSSDLQRRKKKLFTLL
jgi:hypothetical protein